MGEPICNLRAFCSYFGGINPKTRKGGVGRIMDDRSWLGALYELSPRTDLHDYGPYNFDWWDGGNGTLQLALAMLADWLGDDEKALRLHADFAREIGMVRLTRYKQWSLGPQEIREAVARAEKFVAEHGPWVEGR